MAKFKRKFYIIGHNPNTIDLAEDFLRNGANALEPDIVYHEQQFYVCHKPGICLYTDNTRLERYLTGINRLVSEGHNLALIIFDIKDTDFDINYLISIIKDYLTDELASNIALLFTHADDLNFLNGFNQTIFNAGIGVDESSKSPSQIEQLFVEKNQKHFVYAAGTASFGVDLNGKTMRNIMLAKKLQSEHGANSFKLIYPWVIANESSMKAYLNLHVDGMIVDIDSARTLRDLITGEFADSYELAQNGYIPFSAPFPPVYNLTINTRDRYMGGTDAQVKFTLTNNSGFSNSAVLDGKQSKVMETGSVDFLTLEGVDLGSSIKSLTIQILNKDYSSDWLPSTIVVSSTLLPLDIVFSYEKDEWLSFDDMPIITHDI
ncbi:MAG: hypothetical protein ABIT08_10990 [Bacteroidia bacterium]